MKRPPSPALDVARAAYRLAPSPTAWCEAVAAAAAPELDQGLGVLVWVGRSPTFAPEMVGGYGAAGAFADALRENHRIVEREAPAMLPRLFTGPPRLVSARHNSRAQLGIELHEQPGFELAKSVGMLDAIVLQTVCPSGLSLTLMAPSSTVTAKPREGRRWARAAAHLLSALRLREHAQPSPETATAVLTPRGRIEHRTDRAAPLESLRAACLAAEAAQRSSDDEGLTPWTALVSGRYSLTDWFDTDGRRYLLAIPNPPRGEEVEGLSPRETQVAAYLAIGHPLKYVAYELGLSISTVARDAAKAIQKLGLRDRLELSRVLGGILQPR
ncbi:MAG: helix-turn-helix transcriptional regulator [Myxococcales bacterium]|nr:helix-turn-helix transcriptional regulator [Myxococcales bacterium]